MKKTTAFGTAKPLPGQAGYKVSQAEILEKEANEMESRLKMLQERMKQQAVEDEAVHKDGATRWKTARPDKGSVRNYAKDVQTKHKMKVAEKSDPALRATAAARRTNRENNANGTFKTKSTIIQLIQYYITIDVDNWTVDDVSAWLQSMMLQQYCEVFASNEITGPILLDISLEDLDYMGISILAHRKILLRGIEDLRKNKHVTVSLFASSGDEAKATPAPSQTRESRDDSGSEAKKIHWSQLEPISANKPQVSGGNEVPVNLADGDIDEEAEREAFRNAVMEWRRAGKEEPAAAEPEPGMWKDPFAAEAKEESKVASLAVGDLDEAQEHEEFKKAVEAWRRGDSNTTSSTAKERAARLAAQMDAEHEAAARELEEHQAALRRKMAENSRTVNAVHHRMHDLEVENMDTEDGDDNEGEQKCSPLYPRVNEFYDDEMPLSETSSIDEKQEYTPSKHHVEVELLESTLNAPGLEQMEVGVEYVVCEPSDDES